MEKNDYTADRDERTLCTNVHTSRTHGRSYVPLLLLFLEISVLALLGIYLFMDGARADVVSGNATLTSNLTVGNAAPEVLNVTIYNAANGITLVANSTVVVTVEAIARDLNGEDELFNASMEFFDASASSAGAANDNNNHYTNWTCNLDDTYGDVYEVNFTCTFSVWYYANNATWNGTVRVNEVNGLSAIGTKSAKVNTLLSVGLPDILDYGLVNATSVSDERIINISNYGNVMMNVTLRGYGYNENDSLAMNCTLGSTKNISIMYEKYNLTASNTSMLNITEFELRYVNLTNTSVSRRFNQNYRQNDLFHEATNETYWRVYVPTGVAGSCQGHIVIGAIRGSGT